MLTSVKVEGLRHLESLTNFEFLGLTGCPNITDAGVAPPATPPARTEATPTPSGWQRCPWFPMSARRAPDRMDKLTVRRVKVRIAHHHTDLKGSAWHSVKWYVGGIPDWGSSVRLPPLPPQAGLVVRRHLRQLPARGHFVAVLHFRQLRAALASRPGSPGW